MDYSSWESEADEEISLPGTNLGGDGNVDSADTKIDSIRVDKSVKTTKTSGKKDLRGFFTSKSN